MIKLENSGNIKISTLVSWREWPCWIHHQKAAQCSRWHDHILYWNGIGNAWNWNQRRKCCIPIGWVYRQIRFLKGLYFIWANFDQSLTKKAGCVFSMIISSELRIWQYRGESGRPTPFYVSESTWQIEDWSMSRTRANRPLNQQVLNLVHELEHLSVRNWFKIGPKITEGHQNSANDVRAEILYWIQICIKVKKGQPLRSLQKTDLVISTDFYGSWRETDKLRKSLLKRQNCSKYNISGSLLSDMGGVLGFFLGVTMLNCIKETYS